MRDPENQEVDIAGVHPETGKFVRDQGLLKILPQAYG